MVNRRIIAKIIGSLLLIEAFFMGWCAAVSSFFQEDDTLAFLLSALLTTAVGLLLLAAGRSAQSTLSRREAFVVVTAVWTVFSFMGMLPFLIHGCTLSVTDAYFETMSGFTTTGATIFDDVERLPKGILFWRSLMQWIGGLGIVFFTIAVLPSMVGGSVKVFAAEATGPIKAKMHPRLTTTAKWIWSIYLLLTAGCAAGFAAAGLDWFAALNYAMTTTATGGFAIHNDALAIYDSPAVDYIAIVFQFLAGVNFTLLYTSIFKWRLKALLANSELRFYAGLVAAASLALTGILIAQMGYGFERALRTSLFHVVSFVTTTGIISDDIAAWPHVTWIIIGALMIVGGCAGSTSGGFKGVRAVMTLKVLRNSFRQTLHPNAVLPVRINGQSVPQTRINALFAFFTLFMLMILVTAGIMILAGIDIINSIVIALSCVSNVGPSLSTGVGECITWSGMTDSIKWILSLLMLMGRLEIMTVLVLLTPSFWKES